MTSFPKLSYACPVPWAQLPGDERQRHCEQCGRSVTNLSELDETARREFLARPGNENVCITYYRRLSGEFVTPESPLTPQERSGIKQLGLAALSAGALALAAGCMAKPELTKTSSAPLLSASPATDEKSPAPVSSRDSAMNTVGKFDQNGNAHPEPNGAAALRSDAQNGMIVLQPFGIFTSEPTPASVRAFIDSEIQAEQKHESPPGFKTEPFSPILWSHFWLARIDHYRRVGFPKFKDPDDRSGESFVRYVISQRRKLHLPELDLKASK